MATKTKHTAGPWKVNKYKKSQVIFATPDDDNNWGKAEIDGMNLEANAALIAAAPEMYEAIKEALERGNFAMDIHNKLSKALVKAEGN